LIELTSIYITKHEQQNTKMGGYLGCHCLYGRVFFLIVLATFKAICSINTHVVVVVVVVVVNNDNNINRETKNHQDAFTRMYGSL
jgi:hypothetical protein